MIECLFQTGEAQFASIITGFVTCLAAIIGLVWVLTRLGELLQNYKPYNKTTYAIQKTYRNHVSEPVKYTFKGISYIVSAIILALIIWKFSVGIYNIIQCLKG